MKKNQKESKKQKKKQRHKTKEYREKTSRTDCGTEQNPGRHFKDLFCSQGADQFRFSDCFFLDGFLLQSDPCTGAVCVVDECVYHFCIFKI